MLLIAVVAVLAVFLGIVAGYWIRGRSADAALQAEKQNNEKLAAHLAERDRSLADTQREAGDLREKKARLEEQLTAGQEALKQARSELNDAVSSRQKAEEQNSNLREQIAQLSTNLESERTVANEKLELLKGARQDLADHFKSLAADILKDESRTFTEQNQTNIGNLLNPIKEKFGDFQTAVESLKSEGITSRTELKGQIEGLSRLNERLSQEASNLVNALKGSSKTQGDWGELLLEQLLEAAGLRKGQEYLTQETFSREDNKRARVDVILNLPEGRQLIIDSKVSLNDYDEYCSSEDDAARNSALKRHLASMRSHIKELSQREYQTLYGLNSIDFVIMFVPIEPAFMLAMSSEGKLWQEGWDKNVLLVSRTTLLFVLRTVAHLWRQEQQTRNVQEIVRRGGELYEKLVAFIADLSNVGKKLDAARESYDEAFKKLHTGRGSVIWRAEKLRDLGIKPAKSIPTTLVEAALVTPEELTAPLFDEPEDNGTDDAE